MNKSPRHRSNRWLLPLILLAAFAFRLYRLGVASLWYDETVSVFLAQKDLLALTRHTAGDIHPPLYYYLLHFWGRLAGWSEFAVAFLSLIFGVLLVALTYRVTRAWFTPRAALIAACLVAGSPYNLWYSQEVRMYTLGATLGLVATFFFVRLLSNQPATGFTFRVSRFTLFLPRDLIVYATLSALGLYTLYYFAFLLAFQNLVALIWLIRNRRNRTWHFEFRIWIFSQLATLLFFAPWLPIAIRQAIDPPVPPWRSFIAPHTVLLESFSALAFGQSVDPRVVAPMLIVVALILVIALWQNRAPQTASRITPLFLFGYTFVPLAIIYALSLWKPLYHVRYVFPYAPAFYILLALGLDQIAKTVSRFAFRASRFAFHVLHFTLYASLALTASYSAVNFWFDPKYADDDLRGAVQAIAEQWRPGDAVLVNAGYAYTAFVYYFDQPLAWRGRLRDYAPTSAAHGAVVLQTGSLGANPNLGWNNPESDFYATTADETRAALDRVFAAHPRVWQFRIYDTVVDPNGVIRDYLAQHARIIADEGFRGESYARAQGYLTTRAPIPGLPATATRREVVLGNRIALLGLEPATTTLRAGAPLDVDTYWQAHEPTNVDARLFVGLYAANGTLVAATDELPLGNAFGTARWLPGEILRAPIRLRVPTNVTPGLYTLRAMLYNPRTNEPLAANAGAWITADGEIILTTAQIEK